MADDLFLEENDPIFPTPQPQDTIEEDVDDDDDIGADADPKLSRRAKRAQEHQAELIKKDAEIARLSERSKIVDQLQADPNGFLNELATQLGTKMQSPPDVQQNPSGLSQRELEVAQGALGDSPDMQFLAPHVAKVAKALLSEEIAPIKQQAAQNEQSRRQQEFNDSLSKLGERTPTWETYKDEMMDVIGFLEKAAAGGPLSHPKHGSIADMVFRIVAKEDEATALAAQRMGQAARNRITTGSSAPAEGPTVDSQIKKANSLADKMRIAFNAALEDREGALR